MLDTALLILWPLWFLTAMAGSVIVPDVTAPQKIRKIYMRAEAIVCLSLAVIYIARIFVSPAGTNLLFILLFGCIGVIFMLINPPN
ncbi:hypothetical protein JW977_04935 [Candidatus Falkowbacteria bacterium]|nr:hypothetical protein [Candidatus Falkowbacteria bacterium]